MRVRIFTGDGEDPSELSREVNAFLASLLDKPVHFVNTAMATVADSSDSERKATAIITVWYD